MLSGIFLGETVYSRWNADLIEFCQDPTVVCNREELNRIYMYRSTSYLGFILFVLGCIACVAVFKLRRIRNKAIVLYITGFVYFAFIVLGSTYYAYNIRRSDWLIQNGPNTFMIEIYHVAMPLISVIFMGLPFILTFEIMFFAALAFLVLVPLFNETGSNLWLQFDDTSVYEHFISYIIVYAYDRPVYDFIVRTVPISGAKEFASNIYSRCTDPEMKEDHCIDMAR